MAELKAGTKIHVAHSPVHGWGVFASEKIQKGEILEECAFIELPIAPNESSSLLIDYRFNYPAGEATQNTKQVAVLGNGMLYNHSNNSNAHWFTDEYRKCFVFCATREIEKGEEVFTYYGGEDYWKDGRANTNLKV